MNIFKEKKKIPNIKTMIKCEMKLKDMEFSKNYNLLDDNLHNQLKLKVEFVRTLNNNAEARLIPSDDGDYNGVIQIRSDMQNIKFVDAHEIIHYIMDVGVGKKVKGEYTRLPQGNTCDTEQEINYLTAAAIMPYNEILQYIIDYDRNHFAGALRLIKTLQEKYSQSEGTVIRRITEVRRLYKADMNDSSFSLSD